MHEELYDVFEKLCKELCEYGKQKLSMENLKTIDTLAHAGKNVLKIIECEEGGGSYAYYDEDPRNTAMGSMRGSYGGSMRSYRMSNRRDSMGRYSRENSMEGNSMDGSYDGMSRRMSRTGGNNVTDGLKELMYAAPAEMQGEINRLIKKLENM